MRIELRTATADETRAVGEALAGLSARVTPPRSRASSAPERRPWCRGSPRGLGVTDQSSRRPSRWCASTAGRLDRARRRLPSRSCAGRDGSGSARARRRRGAAPRGVGRRRRGAPAAGPTRDRADVAPEGGGVDTRAAGHRRRSGGAGGAARGRLAGWITPPLGVARDRRRHRDLDPQTSVAIGSEQASWPRCRRRPRPAGGGRARPAAAPALERARTSPRSEASPWASAPGCSPGCGWAWRPEDARAGPGRADRGLTSLDVSPSPSATPPGRICAVIDGRRGEVFWSLYEPVPGGVVRETEHAVDTPDRADRELLAVPGTCCSWRRCHPVPHEIERELGGRWDSPRRHMPIRRPHSSSSSAPPGSARGARPALRRRPLYLRKSDAEIAWDQRARGAPA